MNEESSNLLFDLTKLIKENVLLNIESSMPCIVTKVTSRKKVNVRPLIKVIDKSGVATSRDEIEGLPVFNSGAGDFVISFPVKVGDVGWLTASDRDISLFLQSYEDSEPPTKRKHSFSDAYFTPDLMTNFDVASGDSTAVVIQNRNGSVKIAIDQSEIRIVNNETSIIVSGSSVTGVAPSGFDLNGFVINADGSASSPVSITAPIVNASSSLTKAGTEVADQDHDHDAGTLRDAENRPLTGKVAGSNG